MTGPEIRRMVHHGLNLTIVDGDPLAEPRLPSDPGRIWLVLQQGVPVAGQALVNPAPNDPA
jgi:hypothetical protein